MKFGISYESYHNFKIRRTWLHERENTVNSILTALVKKKNKPPVRHGYNEGWIIAHVFQHPENL